MKNQRREYAGMMLFASAFAGVLTAGFGATLWLIAAAVLIGAVLGAICQYSLSDFDG